MHSKIVENIIAQLIICLDDNLDALSLIKSMAFFKKMSTTTTSYCITVKNMKWFKLALEHISIGLSFHQSLLLFINICYYLSALKHLGMQSWWASTIKMLANMSVWVSLSIFNTFYTSWALFVHGCVCLLLIAPRINLCRILTSKSTFVPMILWKICTWS
jgi:hypothetical protein